MIWLAKRHASFQVSLSISNSLRGSGDAAAYEMGEVVVGLLCSAVLSLLGVVLVSGMGVFSVLVFCGSSELVLAIFGKGVRNGYANEFRGDFMTWYRRRGKKNGICSMLVRTDGLFWVTGDLGAWTVIRLWPDMQSSILRCFLVICGER